jgi:hypothetical protein
MGFSEAPVASLLKQSDRMIRQGEAAAMVAARASEESAQCFVLRPEDEASKGSGLAPEEVIEVENRTSSPADMIEELSRL